MSDEQEWNEFVLTLEFDTDDPNFVRGFEAGIIWSFCVSNGNYHGLMHAANTEMVMRIAESLHLPFKATPTASEEWLHVDIDGASDSERKRVERLFYGDTSDLQRAIDGEDDDEEDE